ncbi:hypothetical protein DRJ25_00475 [Candidatus Woesearchaeota archaeon]|nr:MAG: hypothetical protein DRJ25_00475 [Candidatus Woesearchaeota archaeon]
MFSLMFQFGAPASVRYFMRTLQNQGIIYILSDILIPTLLIFTIMFAVLQKVGIFKTKEGEGQQAKEIVDRKFSGLIAFLTALLVVIPHLIGAYDPRRDPIVIIKNILPGGVLILIAILIIMAIIVLTSGTTPGILTFLVAMTGVFFLFYIIAVAVFPDIAILGSRSPLRNPGTQVLLISLLVAAFWLWFLLKAPQGDDAKKKRDNLLEFLGYK